MFRAETLTLWKRVLIKNLGKHISKHVVVISVQLLAVDQDLKPAYLWDCCFVHLNDLIKCLEETSATGLLDSKLRSLRIGSDMFVVKSSLDLDKLLLQHRQFVNVSSHLSAAKLVDSSMHESLIENCKSLLSQSPPCDVEVNNINLCSLYGVILGYPVVFWFEDRDKNCLSGTNLVVYSVMVLNKYRITSFSYPEILEIEVHSAIEEWIGEFKGRKITVGENQYDVEVNREIRNMNVIVL